MPDDLDALRQACEGVSYPSESDYPLAVFEWTAAAADAREAVEDHAGSRELKGIPLEQFFADLSGGDSPDARIRELKKTVEEHLTEPQVFRVGAVEVGIFLIGRSRSGHWTVSKRSRWKPDAESEDFHTP